MWCLIYHGHCDGEEAEGGSVRPKSAYHLGLESREVDSGEEIADCLSPLVYRHIRNLGRSHILCQRSDESVVGILFIDMRDPT